MLGRGRRRAPGIDPFELRQPWRRPVQEALQAQARYQRAVSGVAAGPLRERLDDVGRRIEEATLECWRVARRGESLEDAVSALDGVGTRAPTDVAAKVAEAHEQLARLEAALGQAAATAVALSTRNAASTEAAVLGDDVDRLVNDLVALHSALDEVSGRGA